MFFKMSGNFVFPQNVLKIDEKSEKCYKFVIKVSKNCHEVVNKIEEFRMGGFK